MGEAFLSRMHGKISLFEEPPYEPYMVEPFDVLPTTNIPIFINTNTVYNATTTVEILSGKLAIHTQATSNGAWAARAVATKNIFDIQKEEIEVSCYMEPSHVQYSTYELDSDLWLLFGDYNSTNDAYAGNSDWIRVGYHWWSSYTNGRLASRQRVNGATETHNTLSNHPINVTQISEFSGIYKIMLSQTTLRLFYNDTQIYSAANPFSKRYCRIMLSGAQNHAVLRQSLFDNLTYKKQTPTLSLPDSGGTVYWEGMYDEFWESNNTLGTPTYTKDVNGLLLSLAGTNQRGMYVTTDKVDLTGKNSIMFTTTASNLTGAGSTTGRWMEVCITNDKTGDTFVVRLQSIATASTTHNLNVSAYSGLYSIAIKSIHGTSATGTSWVKLHKVWLT